MCPFASKAIPKLYIEVSTDFLYANEEKKGMEINSSMIELFITLDCLLREIVSILKENDGGC